MSRSPYNICTDQQLGQLLAFYEMNSLDPDQTLLFEEHLLLCEFCRQELEQLMEENQLLLRHGPAIRLHYAQKGDDFAAELARISSSQQRPTASVEKDSNFPTFMWLRWMKRSRRFLLPSLAAVVLAAILVLRVQVSNDSRRSRSEREVAIEQLLPHAPIPFAETLSTRGTGNTETLQDSLFREGMQLYTAGQYQACVEELKACTEIDPSDARVYMYLGSALYMSGAFADATRAFEQAEFLARDNVNPSAMYFHAAALIKLQRDVDALALLKRLLDNPNGMLAEKSRALLDALKVN